jgi:hypothetical protein
MGSGRATRELKHLLQQFPVQHFGWNHKKRFMLPTGSQAVIICSLVSDHSNYRFTPEGSFHRSGLRHGFLDLLHRTKWQVNFLWNYGNRCNRAFRGLQRNFADTPGRISHKILDLTFLSLKRWEFFLSVQISVADPDPELLNPIILIRNPG